MKSSSQVQPYSGLGKNMYRKTRCFTHHQNSYCTLGKPAQPSSSSGVSGRAESTKKVRAKFVSSSGQVRVKLGLSSCPVWISFKDRFSGTRSPSLPSSSFMEKRHSARILTVHTLFSSTETTASTTPPEAAFVSVCSWGRYNCLFFWLGGRRTRLDGSLCRTIIVLCIIAFVCKCIVLQSSVLF